MKKKLLSVIIIITIVLCLDVNIKAKEDVDSYLTYKDGYFTDINIDDWYYQNVISVYEYGLISGYGDGIFNPQGNMKICEAITIASKLKMKTADSSINLPEDSREEWYIPYVKYAESSGIISKGKFGNRYEDYITREEFVYVLCNSVSNEDLKNENPYSKVVPDMKTDDGYYSIVLKAVKSGIISGKDKEGNFYPTEKITRAEAATVINRIIDKSQRKSMVRDILSQRYYDNDMLYLENKLTYNYGAFNNIYCIFRGKYIGQYESVYCYIYKQNELDKYIEMLKSNNYNIKSEVNSNFYQTFTCRTNNISEANIEINVFKEFKQVWINVKWSNEYIKQYNEYNSDTTETTSHKDTWEAWDTSTAYLENKFVSNYGKLNKIKCISREKRISNSGTSVIYKYDYNPGQLLLYYTQLDIKGFKLDPLSVDSNELFLECTYSSRNENVHIFVDLIESVVEIEFPKTNSSDL